jgi:hypothetical protein
VATGLLKATGIQNRWVLTYMSENRTSKQLNLQMHEQGKVIE